MSSSFSSQFKTHRLRFATRRRRTEDQLTKLRGARQVTFIPMEAIGENGDLDVSSVKDLQDVEAGYSLFFENDVVIAKITPCFENGKGAIIRGTLDGVGYGTTELHVLSPLESLDADFLYWITVSEPFRALGTAGMTGAAGQKRVTEDFVRDYHIPDIPINLQQRIASYIRRETGRIDKLIAEKGRLLGLVAEKRRALISRAVTRGLNSKAHLRDSGIHWLGFIPRHWQVKRLRWLLKGVEQGWSPQAEATTTDDNSWAVIKLSAIKSGSFFPEEHKGLPSTYEIPLELEIKSGDFLLTRANTPSLVGDVCLVTETRPKLIFSDLVFRLRLDSSQLASAFLMNFLLTTGRLHIESDARGSSLSMVKISQEHILNWEVPLPPIAEQLSIVSFISDETAKLDKLRAAAERTIALLKERRSALIAAAVTGKISLSS